MQTTLYQQPILDPSINIKNFRSEGVLLKNVKQSLVRFVLNIPLKHKIEWVQDIDELDPNIDIVDYIEFSQGQYVNKVLHEDIEEIMSEFELNHFCDTFCMILLIQKKYMDILNQMSPKYYIPHLLQIADFFNSIMSHRNVNVRLYDNDGNFINQLDTHTSALLHNIMLDNYFSTEKGKMDFNIALKQYEKNNRVMEQWETLSITNKKNTREQLRTSLIQRLFLILLKAIPKIQSRTRLIGKLLGTIGAMSVYNHDIHHEGYGNEEKYYYDNLKYATLKVKISDEE